MSRLNSARSRSASMRIAPKKCDVIPDGDVSLSPVESIVPNQPPASTPVRISASAPMP